jgi:phage repressor protein C with HTH and peptisase S24 domain
MLKGWRKRLKTLLDETQGLDMKSLSKKAGLNDSAIHDILVRGRNPSVENFVAIAEAAGVDPNWLLQGEERHRISIPVVGIVSGGEGWTPVESGKIESVEFELDGHDIIGLEVRGDSMAPVYRDQDFLVCQRHTGRHLQNLIGLDCAIRTTKGEHFVKILRRGNRAGTFSLRSYNPVFKDIENVSLEWAAPIIWIKRGGR